ncbi:DUF6710 family protein [Tissierella carlieri]|uniref:DUF6710 family protein n=1 Tax=Tissierella TaxID=41273 RepID=UPI0030529973
MIKNFIRNYLKEKRFPHRFKGTYGKSSLGFEFDNTMDFVQDILEYEHNIEDQIIIIDFISNLVKEDLKTDLLTTIIYSEQHFERNINFPFPYEYYDKLGNRLTIKPEREVMRDVDLSKDCVLVVSWNRERLRNSIKNIYKNEFEYHDWNHLAFYFTHIDVCYAYNGTHSISSGIGHKKGFIKAKEYDISNLFDHLYTDGVSWHSVHDKTKLGDIFDFRIAILYELAKIKYNLRK